MNQVKERGSLAVSGVGRRFRAWLPIAALVLIVGSAALAARSLTGAAAPSHPAPEPLRAQGGTTGTSPGNLVIPVWHHPQTGWLYVLDVNSLRSEGQILLIDPTSGAVQGAIRTGTDPAMAVSPDGSRLFVASNRGGKDTMTVIDTATGASLSTASVNNRWMDTLPPVRSTVSVAPDGRHAYVVTDTQLSPGADRPGLATFDVAANRFIGGAEVMGCGAPSVVAGSGSTLTAACHSDVRLITGGEVTSASAIRSLSLPFNASDRRDANGNSLHLDGVSGSVRSADGRSLFVVSGAGQVAVVDVTAQQVAQSADLAIGSDRRVLFCAPAVSPDGTRLFVPVGRVADRSQNTGSQVLVVDTASISVKSTIEVGHPFANLAVSRDGSQLFAVDATTRSLFVLDIASGLVVKTFTGIGDSPSIVVVAP